MFNADVYIQLVYFFSQVKTIQICWTDKVLTCTITNLQQEFGLQTLHFNLILKITCFSEDKMPLLDTTETNVFYGKNNTM